MSAELERIQRTKNGTMFDYAVETVAIELRKHDFAEASRRATLWQRNVSICSGKLHDAAREKVRRELETLIDAALLNWPCMVHQYGARWKTEYKDTYRERCARCGHVNEFEKDYS